MLEDEEREHNWQAQRGAAPPQADITQRYNQRQQQSSGDKDIVAEFTEQFNKVAESACVDRLSECFCSPITQLARRHLGPCSVKAKLL